VEPADGHGEPPQKAASKEDAVPDLSHLQLPQAGSKRKVSFAGDVTDAGRKGAGKQPDALATQRGEGAGANKKASNKKQKKQGQLGGDDNRLHQKPSPVVKVEKAGNGAPTPSTEQQQPSAKQQPSEEQQVKSKIKDKQGKPLEEGPAASKLNGVSAAAKDGGSGGGGLLDKMRARLAGGRFRSLNEQLYTCSGEDALRMMQVCPLGPCVARACGC
jgi:hypothetical protein